MEPSLMVIQERARSFLKGAVNRVIKETALPAYLLEGILLDILAEVRAQKNAEILAELERNLAEPPERPCMPEATCADPESPAPDTDQESPIAEKMRAILSHTAPNDGESEE